MRQEYQAFRRIVHNSAVPTIRFHDLRHTHGSLFLKDGIPVKVVSERLGHANIASRCRPTSTSCPACRPTACP
jgi:integrase